jgi:fluoroquinolone transport system permease protein
MKSFLNHLKWQFVILHKNNIITISVAVTAIYSVILFLFSEATYINKILIVLVLNDPSVIGYFFIALALFTEIKQDVLKPIFVSPVNVHQLLIAKILSLSIIGTLCSLGLAMAIKGFDFHILAYTIGSFSICMMSACIAISMMTYATDFLNFALQSVPIVFLFVGIAMVNFLEMINLGAWKYILPIQGSLDLISFAVSQQAINPWYAYGSVIVVLPITYWIGFHLFSKKIIHQ